MWSPLSLVQWVLGETAKHLHADHQDEPPPLPPLAIDEKGWLSGADVEHFPSPRQQALATVDSVPHFITSHWTATGPGTGRSCARRAMKMPAEGQHVGSWHVLICRDGSILQSIPFRRGAWHAGGKSALKFAKTKVGQWFPSPTGKVSMNALGVGVEFEVVGEVRKVGPVWMGWPYGKNGERGPVVREEETVEWRGKRYHTFTTEQECAAVRLWSALAREYPIDRHGAAWGHVDLDPTRKSDPGPVWRESQLPRILDIVYGKAGK